MENTSGWSAGQVAAAGAAGGAAEVLWIGLVTAVLGMDGWHVARAVTASVLPASGNWVLAPWVGLAVHFVLSLALAAVFARTVGRRMRGTALFAAAIGALGLVWAFNFFVLLPVLSPAFTALLPHPATLVSKLLFGAAMAAALHASTRVPGKRA